MRNFLFLISALVTLNTFAQSAYNPITTPNTYRQADNPNYWKNKAPAGYWQQDVHYTIKANIDETKDIIDASEQLVYWNNSPNTLNEIYFHLYHLFVLSRFFSAGSQAEADSQCGCDGKNSRFHDFVF